MKKMLLLLLLALVYSCDKSPNEEVFVEINVDIIVLDESGNDLLDPKLGLTKSIDTKSIDIYYVIDGKEELYYDERYVASRGYLLLRPEGDRKNYSLRLNLNNTPKEAITKTVIQWNKDQRDVIKAEMIRYETGSVHVGKVWLNETLVGEQNSSGRFIVIKK